MEEWERGVYHVVVAPKAIQVDYNGVIHFNRIHDAKR